MNGAQFEMGNIHQGTANISRCSRRQDLSVPSALFSSWLVNPFIYNRVFISVDFSFNTSEDQPLRAAPWASKTILCQDSSDPPTFIFSLAAQLPSVCAGIRLLSLALIFAPCPAFSELVLGQALDVALGLQNEFWSIASIL